MKIGSFTSVSWGEVQVWRSTYLHADGPLAVQLMSPDGEPLTTLSTNMYRTECSRDSAELPTNCFFVKRWGENAEIAAEALASGLFRERPDLGTAESGYVSAPVWEITV